MSYKVRFAAVLVLLVMLASLSSAQTFHGDVVRTGNFSDPGPLTGDLVYKVGLNPVHGSPVVSDDGVVYVLADYSWSGDNAKVGVYAINANNGSVVWHYGGVYSMSTPAVNGGVVYVHAYSEASGGGELIALNASDGSLIWNVSIEPGIGSWLASSSPLVYNGYVYVLSYFGRLYKFDTGGNEIWNISVGSVASSTYMSSPSAWNGTIYVAVNDSGVYRLVALDENGLELWNHTLTGTPKSSPVIYGGSVFISTSERLYRFNATTGQELWNVSFDGTLSTPAVGDGKLYVANRTTMFCFDISSGQELWNYTAISSPGQWDSITSSPAVAGGVLYFATNTANGAIYAINSTSGELIWKYVTDNYVMSSPFVYNGKLYIGADDGNLYIFGLWKGSVVIDDGSFTVTDVSGNSYQVSNFTVLGVLQKLKEVAGINYSVYLSTYDNESLFLSSLAGIGSNAGWWITEVNGQGITKGMQFVNVSDGDTVTFWLFPNNAVWGSVNAKNAPYIVEVRVNAKLVEINGVSAGSGLRGGYVNATVNITSYYTGWISIVVSGTNANGDSIAGITTVRVAHQQMLEVPVMLAVPQQISTGTYTLYVGVYRLSEFPDRIAEYTTAGTACTVG